MELLTPLAVEAKLRQLASDLTGAQIAFREAHDREVEGRHEYDHARAGRR